MKKIKYKNGLIKCICPDCNAIANFDYKDSSREFGWVSVSRQHQYQGKNFSRIVYKLFSCTGCCGRGGVAKIHCNNSAQEGEIEDFYPVGIDKAKVPNNTPDEILAEINEAELCVSVQAWRAGLVILRSVLEKVLIQNGYAEKRLVDKIDAANKDGIITDSRTQKANIDDILLTGEVSI
jgi:hypothetical protein